MRLYSHETGRHWAKSGDPLSLSIRPSPRHGARYRGAWQARYCAWHPHDTSHANWSFWPAAAPHTLHCQGKSKTFRHFKVHETKTSATVTKGVFYQSHIQQCWRFFVFQFVTSHPPVTPTSPRCPHLHPRLTWGAASGSVFSPWTPWTLDTAALETINLLKLTWSKKKRNVKCNSYVEEN